MREDVQVKSTHNEWMLHRALAGDALHDGERAHILSLLGEEEQLLDVMPAGVGYFKPGVLAITTERVLHVYFRRLWMRGFRVRSVPYSQIRRVYVEEVMRNSATIDITLTRPRRSLTFSPDGRQRAREAAKAIEREVARYRFRAGLDP